MPARERTADMIRANMKRAGIPDVDEADHKRCFHSLRHSFITALACAGVHPKQAQALARHARSS